jgi:large subunit ribosomal protein L23
MALFKSKKEEEVKEKAATEQVAPQKTQKKDKDAAVENVASVEVTEQEKVLPNRDLASVIIRPRITEKAVLGADQRVYTFEVRKSATKYDVRDAIQEIYKVTPRKIRIVNKPPRHFVSRVSGRRKTDTGLKKAYVYLQEDDRIDLI